MHYLNHYVGKMVVFRLNQLGQEDKTLVESFGDSTKREMSAKLLGVDAIGIWVETVYTIKEYANMEYPKRRTELVSILIRWDLISGVYRYQNDDINPRLGIKF